MNTYTRTPHTLITISGQVIDKKNVMLAYIKFMQDGIDAFPTKGNVPGIQFNCLNEYHTKDGKITVTVDGRLRALASTTPALLEKRLLYINGKITEICEFLDVKFVNKNTRITDGYIVKKASAIQSPRFKRRRASAPTLIQCSESKTVPDHRPHSDEIVRHSAQSPLSSFHIKPYGDSLAPFVLKGDFPVARTLEGIVPTFPPG